MYYIDFVDRTRSFAFNPDGILIIDYSVPNTTKYRQFRQEIDSRSKTPIPEVSCTVSVGYVECLVAVHF